MFIREASAAPRTGELPSTTCTSTRAGAFETGIRDNLRAEGHHGPVPRIEFVDHHLSHAWQAFYQSPFEEAAVLVVDGSGEEHCVSGYTARKDGIKRVFTYDIPYSLGWYYGAFTAYLGFRANRDEGKLMGLAALESAAGIRTRGSSGWTR